MIKTMPANLTELESEVARLRHELQSLEVERKDDDEITIANYLLTRLEQLGVTSVFGVPGDFNMPLLDYIEDHPRIQWIGNCNELNAAYAADGYARVKSHSIGVVVTTFGVGELSAINGIAGAFSEMVPVLHIVGVPSTVQLKTKPLLHHTLGDARFDVFTKAAEQVTISQAMLMNKVHAAAEIDRILIDCITRARPVYLTFPSDMVSEKVSAKRLKIPLSRTLPPNDPQVEQFVLDEIIKVIGEAGGDMAILVDACVLRHDVQDEVKDLVTATRFPVYSTPMGKTTVSEQFDRYGGVYIGSISDPAIKERVESAKLILSIGGLKSDFNTGMYTYRIPTTHTIELHSDHVLVQHAHFPGIGMKQLLPKLTPRLREFRGRASELAVSKAKLEVPIERDNDITQSYFWPRVGKFFKKKDVIVAETGTSNFGILDVPLPEQSVFVSQMLYSSIGWSVGSTLGTALAARNKGLGRVILFVGDGSMQLGVQEISTMTHHGLTPIIFLINNSGYNIERNLHGMNRKYNDIANWKWTSLLTTLGDVDGTLSRSYTVRDKSGLEKLLDDPEFSNAGKIQLVEVIMGKYDTPRALKLAAELSGKYTEKSAKQL
ncbi:thiamine diphosphate-binding protein [Boletus edulis]|uniref:Thiamine diphosphate-binding protein n=1 Tax=Boletus edulis BED1 TaxID=1328754 RepID=A0AAD4BVH7_BOLED|nr:thiamine diphosphate-binding protein [Boletus edulis]KAF8440815.1 thiamine diphosphate-binding protein [Boletus edulis BED1]